MRIRSRKDFWAGLIFIAIGGGFVLLAQQYRLGDMHRMGPAMFPTLVGALLVVLGVIIALRAFTFLGEPVPRFYLRPIGVSVLAIVLFGVALQWLRVIPSGPVRGLIAPHAAPPRPAPTDAVPAAEWSSRQTLGPAALLVRLWAAVFAWLLGLPLPLWPNS